ncbi:MAG: J domain-containing protein [Ilumatobacter sp.]|uniref:J domain-containing protein n=1 Tax=Ilumatobacter sp. TaxID=1967498 RepID=UPI002614765C|nr:J domain-containing protein [Ilumatobacter sp.]MDJ0768819.1 J domain-containing protein [Ilumatobacter sp.]
MLLAELEVFHTRPAVPTRRVALGHLVLPVDPAPGFGGLLLGAVIANHITGVPVESIGDVTRLIGEVENGARVVQPRLRHRFQVDRHGLSHSRHTMLGDGDDIEFDFATTGSDLAQVLGAVYALERLEPASRHVIAPVLRKAITWRGPIGPALVAHLAGAQSSTLAAMADPMAWALDVLGFAPDAKQPSKREVTRHFRRRMRDVHPDHGGEALDASKAILDLNEARRILTGKVA